MTLTPVMKAELSSGAVRVDETRRAQFGIELEAATVRPMSASLEIPAVVSWDADRLFDVSIRVSGWASDVSAAPGERVRGGRVLFRLFSPELVSAQDDLLRANEQASSGDPAALARRDAARLRLSRLGLAEVDLDQILRAGRASEEIPVRAPHSGVVLDRTMVEGAMVSPGQTLYRLGDLSTVWIEGALPEARVADVRAGQSVSVRVSGSDTRMEGVVDRVLPAMDPLTRTARLRVRVDNSAGQLHPDQWATIVVDVVRGDRLAVPGSAVLYTGPRRLVFVDAGDDLLIPREVTTGMTSEGYVQILSGLSEGERVVRAGTFLVAADSRLKQGGGVGLHGGEEKAPAERVPPAPTADPHAGHNKAEKR
jgi:Cu(I)/Ag(I) efflux system membrane fusion protein